MILTLGIKRQRHDKVLDFLITDVIQLDSSVDGLESQRFQEFSKETLTVLSSYFTKDSFINLTTHRSDDLYADFIAGYFLCEDLTSPIASVEEAFLKLQLISRRLFKPHDINLDALFPTLHNLAWTNKGPVFPEDLNQERLRFIHTQDPLQVSHVDKFPYLVDYFVPSGVRIASGSQVRLGAYLGEGTTIMPAGYVNFNAGTLGQAMVEGRVSAGVVVGDKSDVGGGASIMGTLSGGNKSVISIGKHCLLGANAGTGISLGNGCTIAAGLYVTAGMPVFMYDDSNHPVDIDGQLVKEPDNCVKAIELTDKDYLLFIQDSKTGRTICKPNKKIIELNTSLHVND